MPKLDKQFLRGTEASYREALYLLLGTLFEWDSKLWLYHLRSVDGNITPQTLGSIVESVMQRLYESGS